MRFRIVLNESGLSSDKLQCFSKHIILKSHSLLLSSPEMNKFRKLASLRPFFFLHKWEKIKKLLLPDCAIMARALRILNFLARP